MCTLGYHHLLENKLNKVSGRMSEEIERLKMIFSSQGPEALEKALQELPLESPVRYEIIKWQKTFEDE